MINLILFDVDNTIYPASSNMAGALRNGITGFTADYLGISFDEALRQRNENLVKYGTTINWLTKCHNFSDIEAYMDAVHPKNVEDFIPENPRLKTMLEGIPVKKAVLTNSPLEHTLRILNFYGITDMFESIFDIRGMGFKGKPYLSAYKKPLSELEIPAEETLFIDDVPDYLDPFKEMGGNVLLIDESGKHAVSGLPVIKRITELDKYLKNLSG